MDMTPKDPAEVIALYRSEIVGALVQRELHHGELAPALAELSKQRFRAPRSHGSRTYSVPTLERWYYAFKEGGLEALKPKARRDKGHGRVLSPELRALLLDIRREHPSASVPTILQTLETDGRLERKTIAPSTLRKLYADAGLDRVSIRSGNGNRGKVRLRWQAERPGALWHGDVCHATPLHIDGKALPVRIHGLLDDASRHVIALEARYQEREVDMLDVFVRALRKHGPPDAIYLDNGATYRGQTLSVACGRLGIALLHARPYDAPARGKMERFWRTLREGCLDHCGTLGSLHDLNVRMWAWLDQHYHRAPHAGLLGRSPGAVFAEGGDDRAAHFDEKALREALTVRARRRVRRDNTLAMDGQDWETALHFLAGRLVTVARCMVDPAEPPWLEHEGRSHPLSVVDPVANGKRTRSVMSLDAPHPARVEFNPPKALLDRALGRGRSARHEDEEDDA